MDENGSTWQISIDGSKVKPTNPSPIQVWAYPFLNLICDMRVSWIFEGHTRHHYVGPSIQTWLNNPLSMTWKGDTMVAGDVNGVLVYHDVKAGHVKWAIYFGLPFIQTCVCVCVCAGVGLWRRLVPLSRSFGLRQARETQSWWFCTTHELTSGTSQL